MSNQQLKNDELRIKMHAYLSPFRENFAYIHRTADAFNGHVFLFKVLGVGEVYFRLLLWFTVCGKLSDIHDPANLYSSIVGKNPVVCRNMMGFVYKHLSADNRLAAENNAGYTHNAPTVGTVGFDWSSASSRTITVVCIVSRLW